MSKLTAKRRPLTPEQLRLVAGGDDSAPPPPAPLAASHEVVSQRDAASGLPTGKRM